MINFVTPTSFEEKTKILTSIDPKSSTYLVSDLTTKSFVQNYFFSNHNIKVLEEDSVLRANEFWLKCINQNFFDCQVISTFLTKTLLLQWINENEINLNTSGVESFLGYFQQLLPLIAKNESKEVINEWFKLNSESYLSWGRWYELSILAWDKFLENKIIPQNCLSAFLITHLDKCQFEWNRNLYVDLGTELNLTEVEILVHLKDTLDINVILPDDFSFDKYNKCFSSYKILMEKLNFIKDTKVQSKVNKIEQSTFKRFSTVVSEVKDLTAQVRRWAEQEKEFSEISIVMPNMEQYYPVIKPYFDKEGILINKNEIIIASTIPSVFRWISSLRVGAGKLTNNDLEVIEYCNTEPSFDFDKFKKIYSLFFDEKDLERNTKFLIKYKINLKVGESVLRDDFLKWSLAFWKSSDEHDVLSQVFSQVLNECPKNTKMKVPLWLSYLEQICSKKEVLIEKNNDGVNCLNLASSMWLESKYIYILGLNDKQFNSVSVDSINPAEISKIYQQTGYLVDYFNLSTENYILNSYSQKNIKEIIYSYPETGLAGEVGAPLLFWLEEKYKVSRETEAKDKPQKTYWDYVQESKVANNQLDRVKLDLSKLDYENIKDQNYMEHLKFSPTQLERYDGCPFIFMAERLFRLNDLPEVDFDDSPMDKGRLGHAIVENLCEEPLNLNMSDESIDHLVEKCKKDLNIQYYSDDFWALNKNKYKKIAEQFLNFEKEFRLDFTNFKTIFKEKKISLFWDTKTKSLSSTTGYPMSAVIDRIDESGTGEYVLIDYKSSAGQAKNYESWLKNNMLQMPLYYLIYDYWLKENNFDKKFAGAFYYVLSKMDRNKGLKISEHDQSLYLIKNKRGVADNEAFEHLISEVKEIINTIILQIEDGYFHTDPKDIKSCSSCGWRNICRAPHLI